MKNLVFLTTLLLLVACNRPANEGSADSATGTNAASAQSKGDIYVSEKGDGPLGSGRIDQGGGLTTGKGTNGVTWTNANTGQTQPGPQNGPLPR
jgi:hypothetical protein